MSDVASNEVEVSSTSKVPVEDDPKPEATVSPSKQDNSEILKRAMQHLAAGKRNILVQDLESAVASLALACELLAKRYGETAPELGEAYFLYGKSLLDYARMEAGVIDNGLEGVPSEDEEAETSQVEDPEKCSAEEKEVVIKEVGAALEENFVELEKLKAAEKSKDKPANGEKAEEKLTNGDKKSDEKLSNGHVVENGTAETKSDKEENGVKTNGKDVEMTSADDGKSETPKEGSEEVAGDKKAPDESEEQNSTEEDEEGEGEGDEAGEPEGEENEADEPEPSAKEDAESIGSNEAGPSSAKDTTDKSAMDQEEEEDPSNLQLSWEMLELAKTIFHKQVDAIEGESELKTELEAKLNETYMLLGEVSIENEDYKQAIEDLTTCLKRKQKYLPEDSRSIAETHYQLGVALGFNLQFDDAVNALNDAIGVLQLRIENLKNEKESKDPSKKEDVFYTREKEIAEIEGIVPEIREKIADTNDMKEESIKKLGDKRMYEEGVAAMEAEPSEKPISNGESSKATSSIAHLVKKRKKSDSEAATTNGTGGEGDSAKKPHIEAEPVSTTNGHTNGN